MTGCVVQLELPGKRMLSAIITKWSRAFVTGFDPGASELHWAERVWFGAPFPFQIG